MKKTVNPFAAMTVKDLLPDFPGYGSGGPVFFHGNRENILGDMLRALKNDGDLKPFKKTLRANKPVSIMTLVDDERFFPTTAAEKIRDVYARGNDNVRATLGKDIRSLVQEDATILQYFFPESSIPVRIFAAALIVQKAGVARPTTWQLFRQLEPASAETVQGAIELLARKPAAHKGLNRHLRAAARKAGFRFGD